MSGDPKSQDLVSAVVQHRGVRTSQDTCIISEFMFVSYEQGN